MTIDNSGSTPVVVQGDPTDPQMKGKLARRNLVSAVMQRGVSLISAFVRIPLLLHTLGPAQYGLWLGVFAAAGLSTISDFGLQLAVTQRVAELRGLGRTDEVRRVVATAFWLAFAGFAIITCITLAWVGATSPFGQQAAAAGVRRADVRALLLLACIASFAIQPPKILVSAQYGFERMYALHICDVVGIVVNLCGLWLLTGVVGDSLVVLGAWTVLWDLGLGLIVAVVLVRRHPANLSISPRDFRRDLIAPLFRQAAAFFFGTVANGLRWSLDGVFILAILGPTFVPRYEPSMRLFLAGLTIVHIVFGTLWPSFAESAARHDWAWVNRAFGVATVTVLGLATVVFTLAQLFGRDLLLRWVGPPGFSSQVVLLTLGLWFLVSAWVLIAAHLTISLGGALTVMRWGLAEGIVNIGLTILLAHVWGLAGVALASLVAVVAFGAVPLTLRLRALTESRVDLPVRAIGRLTGLVTLVMGGAWYLHRVSPATMSVPVLIPAVTFTGLITLTVVWFLVMGAADRQILRNQVRSGLQRQRPPP
ncbi:MAG: lipopolysaccharide biosynthesis protein [Acidimicrobiales bacterium]